VDTLAFSPPPHIFAGSLRWPKTLFDFAVSEHQAQLLVAAGNPETAAAPVWRKVS